MPGFCFLYVHTYKQTYIHKCMYGHTIYVCVCVCVCKILSQTSFSWIRVGATDGCRPDNHCIDPLSFLSWWPQAARVDTQASSLAALSTLPWSYTSPFSGCLVENTVILRFAELCILKLLPRTYNQMYVFLRMSHITKKSQLVLCTVYL